MLNNFVPIYQENQIEKQVNTVTVEQLKERYEVKYGHRERIPWEFSRKRNKDIVFDILDDYLYSQENVPDDYMYDIIAERLDYNGRITRNVK